MQKGVACEDMRKRNNRNTSIEHKAPATIKFSVPKPSKRLLLAAGTNNVPQAIAKTNHSKKAGSTWDAFVNELEFE